MPSVSLVSGDSGCVIPGTSVKTESTATILNKKIVGRMVQGGSFEIRDLFDLHTAKQKDRRALDAAIRPIRRRTLDNISSILQSLPPRWFDETTQPLVGVENPPSSDEMVASLVQSFDRQLGREDRFSQ